VAGIADITIGDSLVDPEDPRPLPPIRIDDPAISMTVGVNTSPLAGEVSGHKLTARQVKDRLDAELVGNVSIRVLPTDRPDQWEVRDRGELALALVPDGVVGVLAEAVLAVLDVAVELADHLGAGPQEVEAVGVVVDVDLVLEVGVGQGGLAGGLGVAAAAGTPRRGARVRLLRRGAGPRRLRASFAVGAVARRLLGLLGFLGGRLPRLVRGPTGLAGHGHTVTCRSGGAPPPRGGDETA